MKKKTKVHKVTLCVVDHDDLGPEEVKVVLENQKYPNWCIHPRVRGVETREVEWSDDHPLNLSTTSAKAFEDLFAPAAPQSRRKS